MCLSWFKIHLNKRKKITNVNGVLGQESCDLGHMLFIM